MASVQAEPPAPYERAGHLVAVDVASPARAVTSTIVVPAPAPEIRDALEAPSLAYGWLLGATRLTGQQGRWPQPGAELLHVVELPGVPLPGATRMLERSHDVWRTEVRTRGLGRLRTQLELRCEAEWCRVTARVTPLDGPVARLPLTTSLLSGRTRTALQQLRARIAGPHP